MSENKKTRHWAKSLDNAGYLDEVADGWTLPESESIAKAKITVEGTPRGRDTSYPPKQTLKGLSERFVSNTDLTSNAPQLPDQRSSKTTDPVPPYDDNNIQNVMKEKFAVGDYSGALNLAEKILEEDQENNEASHCRLQCRKTLMQMYESRIGSFSRVPKRMVSPEEIIWRSLDPIAGFIMASVDGTVTFEDIIDISSLSRFDACRVLNQLMQDGIIR